MNIYKYFPVASDRMGTVWTLGSIKDAYIVEFGPGGTTHFAIEGFMHLNSQEEAHSFTTHLDESDIAFGSHKRLEKAIEEVDKIYNPEIIFVMGSSISAIIGIDIKSICFMLQDKVKAKLIPIDTGGFKGDLSLGIRNTLKLLCKEVVENPVEKKTKTYNIIGSQVDYFNYKSDIYEIKEIMREAFGYTCNCVFTSETSIKNIKKASESEFNIVIRSEGIEGAEILKKKYDQEYVLGRPYGLKKTLEWIKTIEGTIGIKADKNYIDEKSLYIQDAIMKANVAVRDYNYKNAIVSGNYDLVCGMYWLLKEIGVEMDCGIVLHSKKGKNYFEIDNEIEDRIKVNISEDEKISLLKEHTPSLVLGDGALVDMANSPVKIQVANPNLYKVMLYDRTPFVGFSGCMYIIELLLNNIKKAC